MAKIVVTEFVSLDGVMEAPGGEPGYKHTGWVAKFQDSEQIQYKLEEVLAHQALLLGRITYESFAGAWPYFEGEFGEKMNSMPKFVVSTTLKNPEWNNATVLNGDAMTAVAQLKSSFDGNILVNGSRTLVTALIAHDLVDEIRLMVFPIVLGSGFRLFADADDAKVFELVHTHRLKNGAVELTYRRG